MAVVVTERRSVVVPLDPPPWVATAAVAEAASIVPAACPMPDPPNLPSAVPRTAWEMERAEYEEAAERRQHILEYMAGWGRWVDRRRYRWLAAGVQGQSLGLGTLYVWSWIRVSLLG